MSVKQELKALLLQQFSKRSPFGTQEAPPRHPAHHRQAQVIAVASSKGGVGKTTTAVHVAAGLALFHDKRVLLVDLDPQGHVSVALAAQAPPHTPPLSELFLSQRPRELLESAFASGLFGLSLTPSDKSLADTEGLLSAKIGKELILRGLMESTRSHFDAIVIDCPPHVGNLTLNALLAADHLLIPTDLSMLAIEGVGTMCETVETIARRMNHRLNLLGIVRTKIDRRTTTTNQLMTQALRDLYGACLLEPQIPSSSALIKAQLQGQSLYQFDPKGSAALSYQALIAHLMPAIFPAEEAHEAPSQIH